VTVLIGVLIVLGVIALVARRSPRRPTGAAPVPVVPRAAPARTPFAEPGLRGSLFTYGGPASASLTQRVDAYAVLDFQTTGLAPRGGDRVVEIAVVRIEDGIPGEPWSTLVDPGRDTGAAFVHGIQDRDVASAPTFAEVAPYLLTLLSGAVVVAHNATFDEEFLAAELDRAGHSGARMPALCTLWLAQRVFQTPNHKLPTLARELQVPMSRNVSRDHVIATAAVLEHALRELPVRHACPPYRWTGGSVAPPRVVNRVVGLRKGTDGYMSSLLSKLPVEAAGVGGAEEEAYLDALGVVMADGQITREEATELAALAGAAGLTGPAVAGLNERFLESLREAALADDVLTSAELRDLRRAAKALGTPAYFDDLTPTPAAGRSTGAAPRRCGHCGQPGHYRPKCPELTVS
jgi:DNA polymerase III subunit epsilon